MCVKVFVNCNSVNILESGKEQRWRESGPEAWIIGDLASTVPVLLMSQGLASPSPSIRSEEAPHFSWPFSSCGTRTPPPRLRGISVWPPEAAPASAEVCASFRKPSFKWQAPAFAPLSLSVSPVAA